MKRLLMALLLVGGVAQAKDYTVKVNGMVCSFCSQGLSKKLKEEPAVHKFDISLEKKIVKLTTKEGKDLSEARITELVKNAGFNVESIKAE